MLKDKVCVKNEGITQEIFNVMVEVARESGLDMRMQNKYAVNEYTDDFIGADGLWECLQDIESPTCDNYTEITLEQWLFACAPEWAVCIFKMKGGGYLYGDGNIKSVAIDGDDYCEHHPHTADTAYKGSDRYVNAIYTRNTKEVWAPKVGEVCLNGNIECTPVVLEPDADGVIIIQQEGGYRFAERGHLKPLPKHTDNEILAYELYSEIFTRAGNIDDIKNNHGFKKCLKIVESGRFK